ncbi:MAG: F-type H+-transporting ATPase subunit alpha, partial [Paraglaciecola sp.]
VSGTLKLDQAQYRELEAFAKFGSDLDASTQAVLAKGERNVEVLKQPQFSPMAVEKQVAIIYLASKNLMRNVPVDKIRDFQEIFLLKLENMEAETLKTLKAGKLTDDAKATLERVAAELVPQYKG